MVKADDMWGMWAAILAVSAGGAWSERTSLGRILSAPLVATLLGLIVSNLGVIPSASPLYSTVNSFLLPLAVPLLLFGADLRRALRDTGRLLAAFFVGAVGTVVGTFVAIKLVPLRFLGQDGWKIAAALMSRHIGGAVNYVAVSEALSTSSSIVAAGLAADNLICAIYFATLFALASKEKSQSASTSEDTSAKPPASASTAYASSSSSIPVNEASLALALSAFLCWAGVSIAKELHFKGGSIPCITALVVFLATAFPQQLGKLAPAGEGLAALLLQVFFATIGANGSIGSVLSSAPSLFLFSLIQIAVHLGFTLLVGRILKFPLRELLVASNANVGGPTTAAGMASSRGWKELVVPGILVGIFGYAVATFLSIGLGITVLQKIA